MKITLSQLNFKKNIICVVFQQDISAMEEEKGPLIKRVERLKKRVSQLPPRAGLFL